MIPVNFFIFVVAVVTSIGLNLLYQVVSGSQPHYLLDFLFFGIGVILGEVIFYFYKKMKTNRN